MREDRLQHSQIVEEIRIQAAENPRLRITGHFDFMNSWIANGISASRFIEMPNTTLALETAKSMYEIERERIEQENPEMPRMRGPLSPPAGITPTYARISQSLARAAQGERFK